MLTNKFCHTFHPIDFLIALQANPMTSELTDMRRFDLTLSRKIENNLKNN